jgi:hypothetical protein
VWDINMPYGRHQEEGLCPWDLGTLLVWYECSYCFLPDTVTAIYAFDEKRFKKRATSQLGRGREREFLDSIWFLLSDL